MTLVLVDRDALGSLLCRAWSMFTLLAQESGYEQTNLEPSSELVTLAVQAGLPIPGPMAPGTVPPAPPEYPFDVQKVFDLIDQCEDAIRESVGSGSVAGVYRSDSDPRLRCLEDDKVVYTSMEQAEHAAKLIGQRQPMRAYFGRCGHYHVSRIKGDRR